MPERNQNRISVSENSWFRQEDFGFVCSLDKTSLDFGKAVYTKGAMSQSDFKKIIQECLFLGKDQNKELGKNRVGANASEVSRRAKVQECKQVA